MRIHIRIHCGKDPQREGSESPSVLSWASFPFQLSDLASGSENCIGPKSMCEVGFLGFAMTMYCWMGANRQASCITESGLFLFPQVAQGRGFQNIEQAWTTPTFFGFPVASGKPQVERDEKRGSKARCWRADPAPKPFGRNRWLVSTLQRFPCFPLNQLNQPEKEDFQQRRTQVVARSALF